MSSFRGGSPLIYRQLSRADLTAVELLDLDPDQVARYLGPLSDILDAVRNGPVHSLLRRSQVNLRPECLQQAPPFQRHGLGHRDDEPVPLGRARKGEYWLCQGQLLFLV